MSERPADRTGVFVVFEGGDGAGKTTQLRLLVDWLAGAGVETVITREPGGTDLGQEIRALVLHGAGMAPRAEALLFAADRANHIATVVRPALERGAVVLQDRYVDSSVAYQGAGRDLDPEEIARLSWWATEGLRPDLTVLLDVSPETGHDRRDGSHDRLEQEAEDFHARVRAHFLHLAAAEPHRYLVVNAARPVEQIAETVRTSVAGLLEERRP